MGRRSRDAVVETTSNILKDHLSSRFRSPPSQVMPEDPKIFGITLHTICPQDTQRPNGQWKIAK